MLVKIQFNIKSYASNFKHINENLKCLDNEHSHAFIATMADLIHELSIFYLFAISLHLQPLNRMKQHTCS